MTQQPQAWYNSGAAKLAGTGILLYGLLTGGGNVARGIGEAVQTQRQVQVVRYEMDKATQEARAGYQYFVERLMEKQKNQLSKDQVDELLKGLAYQR